VRAQLLEMASLFRLPNGVTPDDYFAMRLFDDARLDWPSKTTFLGRRAKSYLYRINDPAWQALADDKLASSAQLAAFGLPLARIVAVHHATRVYPGAWMLRSLDEVGEFLRGPAPYPLFSKPNHGTLGRGGHALSGHDRSSDVLLLMNGERVAMTSYLDRVSKSPGGTIFQELVKPHPLLTAVTGGRLSTVRVLVLNGDNGPAVHRAVWRIPVGGNMVDTFRPRQYGNLLASLDLADGRVGRVIAGTGLDTREVDRHPDTNHPFAGLRLPDWDTIVELSVMAGTVMNGIRIQGWDLALSDRGPLLMEVNFRGNLDLCQIADCRGVADQFWRRFVSTHTR